MNETHSKRDFSSIFLLGLKRHTFRVSKSFKEIVHLYGLNPLNIFWPISIIFIVMIGRYWDPRLSFGIVNVPFLVMLIAPVTSVVLLFYKKGLNRNTHWVLTTIVIIAFYNSLLYTRFGVNSYDSYSFIKMAFLFNIIPVLVHFKYSYKYLNEAIFLLYIILGVIVLMGLVKSFFSSGRLSVLGGGPIIFARWTGIFVILSYHFLSKGFLRSLIFTIGIFLILKSGSKGPLLFFLIAFILPTIKLKIRHLIGSLVALFALLNLRGLIQGILGPRVGMLLSGEIMGSTSAMGRIERWSAAWDVFRSHPSGVGIGNFVPYSKQLSSNNFFQNEYPHNFFLELIAEMGYLGIVLGLFVFGLFVSKYARFDILAYRRVLLFLFLNMQISGDIMDGRLFYLMIF